MMTGVVMVDGMFVMSIVVGVTILNEYVMAVGTIMIVATVILDIILAKPDLYIRKDKKNYENEKIFNTNSYNFTSFSSRIRRHLYLYQ